jgi:hypothetical protein
VALTGLAGVLHLISSSAVQQWPGSHSPRRWHSISAGKRGVVRRFCPSASEINYELLHDLSHCGIVNLVRVAE